MKQNFGSLGLQILQSVHKCPEICVIQLHALLDAKMAHKTMLGTLATASVSNTNTREEAVFAGCVVKSCKSEFKIVHVNAG